MTISMEDITQLHSDGLMSNLQSLVSFLLAYPYNGVFFVVFEVFISAMEYL